MEETATERQIYASRQASRYMRGFMVSTFPPWLYGPSIVRTLKTYLACQWTEGTTRKMSRHALNFANENKKNDLGFVYVLHGGDFYKIGMTRRPSTRIAQIQPALPFKVRPVVILPSYDMAKAEKRLHESLDKHRMNGEWFVLEEDMLHALSSIPFAMTCNDVFTALFRDNGESYIEHMKRSFNE